MVDRDNDNDKESGKIRPKDRYEQRITRRERLEKTTRKARKKALSGKASVLCFVVVVHFGLGVVFLQAGMIRTSSDEYFIEPLERGAQEHEEKGRVHVVYRRSAVRQAPSDISVDYQLHGRPLLLCLTNVDLPSQ